MTITLAQKLAALLVVLILLDSISNSAYTAIFMTVYLWITGMAIAFDYIVNTEVKRKKRCANHSK